MITEICGTTPEDSTLRRKISAYPASDTTPSWMRAPAPSLRPIIGHPVFAARSITLTIFSANAPDRLPPKTVKFELVQFDERAAIEQEFDTLAGRHPAVGTLPFEPFFAAAKLGLARQFMNLIDVFLKSH